jgi:hypothetical protein
MFQHGCSDRFLLLCQGELTCSCPISIQEWLNHLGHEDISIDRDESQSWGGFDTPSFEVLNNDAPAPAWSVGSLKEIAVVPDELAIARAKTNNPDPDFSDIVMSGHGRIECLL